MKVHFLLILLLSLLVVNTSQASWRSKVRAGEKRYEKGQYEEALVEYLKALEQKGDTSIIQFGLGNVLQAKEKFEDAGKAFSGSLSDPDSGARADAFYNLGNALFGSRKYEEAVQSYKEALKLKPGQRDYLHNLELAYHLLENPPQQQQQQQNQKDQKNQDQQQQENQEQKQKEQLPDSLKQEQEKQQQQQDQQEQQQQEQQQQQAQTDTLSKEDAERLLNALQTNEKQVQENLRKQPVVAGGKGKDW